MARDARAVAEQILETLADRGGLDGVIDGLDYTTRREIVDDLAAIIEEDRRETRRSERRAT